MMPRGARIAGGAALSLIALGAIAAAGADPAFEAAFASHPSLVASIAAMAVFTVFLGSPFLLMAALPTSRVADGDLERELLETAGARRLPLFALRRLTRSRRGAAGALAAGVLPGTRVVFLPQHLADGPPSDEARAIFAHELGHFAHGHLAWQMLLLAGATLLAAPAVHLGDALPTGPLGSALSFAPAAIWCVLCAVVSRAFELEAEAYAAGALGAERYRAALARLAERHAAEGRGRGDFGTWIHPSLRRRREFALAFSTDPRIARDLRRRGTALRTGIAGLLLAGLLGIAASLAIELGRL